MLRLWLGPRKGMEIREIAKMSSLQKRKMSLNVISRSRGQRLPGNSYHKRRSDALSTLIKISTAIGFMPMELKASLQFLVDETKKLLDAYDCVIFPSAGDIKFEPIYSGPLDPGKGILEELYNTQECVVIRDGLPFLVDERGKGDERCRGMGLYKAVRSYCCLPISTPTRVVGILRISSLKKRAFDWDQLEMLLSVAGMAASVIERARLFGELTEEKRRLEKANEEIRHLNKDLQNKIIELKDAQSQVIQAAKFAVAGRLAAGVAHEINNPTSIIINRIECLQAEARDGGIPDNLLKDLETIGRYAQRISKIVKDLSIFSRTTYTESDLVKVDLNDILADVLFLIDQKVAGKKIRVIKELHPEGLFIIADSDRLAQAFINILDNAIDAVCDEGVITVSTRPSENGYVQAEISDTGVGISPEVVDEIYDPFFTTKEVGKGSGLGLTITRAIVEDHKGSIRVKSTVNKGTTFTVSFPGASEGSKHGNS